MAADNVNASSSVHLASMLQQFNGGGEEDALTALVPWIGRGLKGEAEGFINENLVSIMSIKLGN